MLYRVSPGCWPPLPSSLYGVRAVRRRVVPVVYSPGKAPTSSRGNSCLLVFYQVAFRTGTTRLLEHSCVCACTNAGDSCLLRIGKKPRTPSARPAPPVRRQECATSPRGGCQPVSFEAAIGAGYAPDGGLYIARERAASITAEDLGWGAGLYRRRRGVRCRS